MTKLLATLVLSLSLASALLASQANIWIQQTAQGADDGTSAGNAHAVSWMNNAFNYGAGASQAGPGSIFHLTGTFNWPAVSTMIAPNCSIAAVNGSPGNPITIRLEPGCVLANQIWGQGALQDGFNDGAILINGGHDWTIDGSGQTGIITNTADGTGLLYHAVSVGVHIEYATNIIVTGLQVDLYKNLGNDSGGQRTDCIRTDGDLVNVRICSNYVAHSDTGVAVNFRYLQGMEIDHNTTFNHNWGIGCAPTYGYPSSHAVDRIKIHDNDISNWDYWGCPGSAYHSDGIICWSYQHVDNGPMTVAIYNNYVHGHMINIPGGSCSATAFIFWRWQEADTAATIQADVHNNLCVADDNSTLIWTKGDGDRIDNNTLINGGGNFGVLAGDNTKTDGPYLITNNIFAGGPGTIGIGNQTGNQTISDYNLFTNIGAVASVNVFSGAGPIYNTLASWNAATGNDGNGSGANPLLSGAYIPQTGSPAIAAGKNLSSQFTTDKAGNSYPGGSTPWDLGAYISGGSPPPANTNPVTKLSLSAIDYGKVSVGGACSATFYVTNVGYPTLTGTVGGLVQPYSVGAGGTYSLASNAFQQVTINFTPGVAGVFSQTAQLTDNGGSPGVSLTGLAYPVLGLNFQAGSGTVVPPFASAPGAGCIAQPVDTGIPGSGEAVYGFNLAVGGSYMMQASVVAPDTSANSFFINVDAEPQSPGMTWDIVQTNALQETVPVSWRGTGTPFVQQFPTNVWQLAAGPHYIVVRGREANCTLCSLTVLSASLPPPAVPPVISFQPLSLSVVSPNPITLSVGASGTAPLSYQWTFFGTNLTGATLTSLTFFNSTSNNAGPYYCVVTNVAGAATSAVATVTVNYAARILKQSLNITTTVGSSVALAVVASGTPSLFYQWSKAGAVMSGATASRLAFPSAQTTDTAAYTCVVTNLYGSATSTPAINLLVTNTVVPPTVMVAPTNAVILQGGGTNFVATATGTLPLDYQWWFNGAVLVGQTTSALAISNAQPFQSGIYAIYVSNGAGQGSNNATLTVIPVAPTILRVTHP